MAQNFTLGGLTTEDYRPTEVLATLVGHHRVPGTIAASSRPIRLGDILAKDSNSGKIMVRRHTLLSAQGSSSDTTIHVDDPWAWAVGDPIQVVGESATTVKSIDYDAKTIELNAALTGTRAIGVVVKDATYSRDVAVGIHSLGDPVPSKAVAQTIAVCVSGTFMYDKVRNLDAAAISDLHGMANATMNILKI